MAESIIRVHASRARVRQAIKDAVKAASGRGKVNDAALKMQVKLGQALLSRIHAAFQTKSHGGTDDCGLRWPPLSPKTIAYRRRRGPSSKAGTRPSWILTPKQRSDWWNAYRRGLAIWKGDKTRAAKHAWAKVKGSGAKTVLGTYGNSPALILRDLELLMESLKPGTPGQVPYQVFRVNVDTVIVGTNRPWASVHHKGTARIPQRRLWAEPSQWPQAWWDDLARVEQEGLVEILESIMGAL